MTLKKNKQKNQPQQKHILFSLQSWASLQIWRQYAEWVWSYLFQHPHCCYLYFSFWLQRRSRLHMSQILQIEPRAISPWRLRVVHRLPAAKPGSNSKDYATQSLLWNVMVAIKPFIFYVLVSWMSYCWRRQDAGPTSQKSQLNYPIWIIHRVWRRYLLKGQTCLYFPLTVKGRVQGGLDTWFQLDGWNTLSSDTPRTIIHTSDPNHHDLLEPESKVRIFWHFWHLSPKIKLFFSAL